MPGHRILLIDDDESTLLAVSRMLQKRGFETHTCESGREGLKAMREWSPDLVVCDLSMPEMDGFEVLTAVRGNADTAQLPFILLTASDERENVLRSMRLGADDFLSKPVKPDDLVDAVNQVSEKRMRLGQLVSGNALAPQTELRERYSSKLGDRAAPEVENGALAYQTGRLVVQSVLFTDIRGFTAISERLPASAIAEFLTEYLRDACRPVIEQGGRIMKFMGDGMMAVFGYEDPENVQAHAAGALRAGLGIIEVATKFRGWLTRRFDLPDLAPFDVGVGIHTGEVMYFRLAAGGVGDLTAVGDTVNVASRLETKSKELGWRLVVSSATLDAAGKEFAATDMRELDIPGRSGRIIAGHVVSPEGGSGAEALDDSIISLPAGMGAVVNENARATAEAAKAALDHTLSGISERLAVQSGQAAPKTEEAVRVRGYRVLEKIGEGAMSKVFLAEDDTRHRRAVLKILKVTRVEDEDLWQRFFQECAILSAIEHEHVVRIYDQGFGDEMAYIAMEHLGGGSLREAIDRGLSPRQSLALLTQAASALAEIHNRGIVHRDIKPANLMLRTEGVLVLTDFGVAKRLEQGNARTIHGEVLGTPNYMAPEQIQSKPVGPKADLYGLGVIFFEMLMGKRPYGGTTIMEILSQHVIAPIPRLPEELADYQPLVDGMLAKRAEDRFADAESILEEIDRVWTALTMRRELQRQAER